MCSSSTSVTCVQSHVKLEEILLSSNMSGWSREIWLQLCEVLHEWQNQEADAKLLHAQIRVSKEENLHSDCTIFRGWFLVLSLGLHVLCRIFDINVAQVKVASGCTWQDTCQCWKLNHIKVELSVRQHSPLLLRSKVEEYNRAYKSCPWCTQEVHISISLSCNAHKVDFRWI
jgi:hypothetical protein